MVSATQLFVRFQGQYEGGWFNFFWRQAVVWVGWAILTPLIFSIVNKVDHNQPRWKLIGTLTICALGFTLAYSLIVSLLSFVFFNSEASVWQYFNQSLITSTAANLLVYLLVAFCSLLVIFYQKSSIDREQRYLLDLEVKSLEKQLVTAQLDTLKSQIRPHFLFNALHSVASLIRKEELDKAIQTLAVLSDLLRATLKNQDKNLISLEEELELTQKYLEIEKIRFGQNLKVDFNISKSSPNALVPAFILQPLVENCFKHAFKDRNEGSLSIDASIDKSLLHLYVIDNGDGLKHNLSDTENHMGIRNVKLRLNKLYKNTASFLLQPNQDGGATASLIIPVQQS